MKLIPIFLCALVVLGAPAFGAGVPVGKPNVLVILADDQGWGDLSVNGNTNLATPHVDSLASAGAMFDRFYVCPVCSPTRSEFLTGRYHPRSGVFNVSTGGERMSLAEKTIADTFKAAGYATGAFGKWHNGMQYPYHYVPFNSPHTPAQVPDRFYSKFAHLTLTMRDRDPERENVDKTRAILAMCENVDWNVGRLLQKLDALKLADNTIVIYFSDNGPNGWRWNGGMKGRKGSVDEGGVRAPFFIRWPGRIPGGAKISKIAGAIDLLPTLADLAGIPVVSAKPLDGVSLKPLLLGGAKDRPDRMIFSHWAGKVSVRTQRHRFVVPGQLFDMVADPGQDRNVAKEQPEVAARLSSAVEKWKGELLPSLGKQEWPFTVGYRELPITQLPARDGVPHGNVKRSARAPNCSFFTNWTSADDRITWDVEVATAGRYEAVVYYTCPKADTGSVIEIGFNGSRIEASVSEAHNPPLRGQEHDRFPREGESLVKDFKPMRLGVMDLKPCRGELTLRALKVSGKTVMDVRLILLTLVK
ncbi:MAG: sulfatase-like hydrolase/transferase [Verrucomicrobia bacterium]|nr:sulfatase-like hydrolase/transferase [Verrucomicrobiota bacterium]